MSEKELDQAIGYTFPASDPPSITPVAGTGGPMRESGSGPVVRRYQAPAFGFTLSSEELSPEEILRIAQAADRSGIDFLSISDHFHPWLPSQGNSPAVWPMLGAIAATTERIVVGTGVTCPIQRIHPVIIAQQVATVARMFAGRFYLGLGTGEALNELVTGERWPSAHERLERLEEAIAIIRELWQGGLTNFDGRFFRVIDARIYTRPDQPPPILVGAGSPAAARLAASQDGMISTAPNPEYFAAYDEAGGNDKPRIGQLSVCWAKTEEAARQTAHQYWRNTVLNWDTSSWINTPEKFDDATKAVTPEQVAEKIVCGPDLGKIRDAISSYVQAGFDHVYLHQVGPNQLEFLDVYTKELLPQLRTTREPAKVRGAA